MNQFSILLGALRYEFRMQIRRVAVWITMILFICLLTTLSLRYFDAMKSFAHQDILAHLDQFPLTDVLVQWTTNLNKLLPIGIGVLLADRLPRDRRTRVDELFTAMPAALSARLLGKYLGSMLATLVPYFAFYMLGVGYILYQTHNLLALPLGLATFAAIVLPGILFISAFSLACPALLWVPLYQFCFVGYWFWGNMLSPRQGIPTLSNTILTPIGNYMAQGFFRVNLYTSTMPTPLEGLESMLALIGFAIFALSVLYGYMKFQQAHA